MLFHKEDYFMSDIILTNRPKEKRICDLCGEEPENKVLFEKPNSMFVDGSYYVHIRPKPLYVCLNCLWIETENF